ncbi:RNA polymerase sigma factor [Demequina sp. NBRC 110055]|uniref:RNA polymerase sigma factor n=1 Tax=Demequina sp. NBRC 110055 TaxID=1570344 RepID=UPI0009FEF261|nr:RNA polymerase sigma factor [Demequina sp. NBRC 110055]
MALGESTEDVLSETFLSVARDIHRFTGDESDFRAWVFTIARRRGHDEWRSRGRHPETADGLEPAGLAEEHWHGDVESEALSAISLIELRVLIRGLSLVQREVILMRVVADMSVKETAQALDKSEGAVRVIQTRALKALREQLDTHGHERSILPGRNDL